MTQLTFVFPDRWETPASRTSWRDGDRVRVVYVGAHSWDSNWSFWQPWDVKALAEQGSLFAETEAS